MKYPKILSTIVTLCMVPSLSRAQPSELSIAVKGGPNAATQDENLRVNRYGVAGGLGGYLDWQLIDLLSLAGQAELLYMPRGAKVVVDGQYIGQIREHYIDFTLAVRPTVHFGRVSAYLLLGGELNFLVTASKDDGAGAGQDITSGLHRVDVALLGAAGVALHLPHRDLGPLQLGTVFLEARHDIGLLDVDLMGGFKNRTSSLMLGLSFVVGGAPTPPQPTSQVADLFRARLAPRE